MLSETTKLALYINSKKSPDATSKELDTELGNLCKNVTTWTMRNTLIEKGCIVYRPIKKLHQAQAHTRKRYAWAKQLKI